MARYGRRAQIVDMDLSTFLSSQTSNQSKNVTFVLYVNKIYTVFNVILSEREKSVFQYFAFKEYQLLQTQLFCN